MSKYKLASQWLKKVRGTKIMKYPSALLLSGLVLVTLGLLVSIHRVGTVSPIVSVVLTEDGFSPSETEITVGQTVVFTSTRNKIFWPASDIHPTHEIYPEFDPKNPIKPTESWSFKFDRVGSWRYHDHLTPYYTGVIKVKNPPTPKVIVDNLVSRCPVSKGVPATACWNEIINISLQDRGVGGAFDLMTKLYNKDPGFAENCHSFAHDIGYALYQDYVKSGKLDFKVTTATTYCGYGFFHGFMTRLFGSGKDIKLARDFCTYIDAELSKLAPDSTGSCYHGIGHGSVVDPDKSLWGKPDGLIDTTVKMCRSLGTSSSDELSNCYNGVFNGLGTLYTNNQYEFHLDDVRAKPYTLCLRQADDLKNSCYLGMYIVALFSANGDLLNSAKIVETIPEDKYAQTAMVQLSANVAYKDTSIYLTSPFFGKCRIILDRLRDSCLKGGIKAIINNSSPGQEYKKLDLCQSSQILSSERTLCYQASFEALKAIYPKYRIDELCLSLDRTYRSNCQ